MNRISKILCSAGLFLLFAMALFHGSGFWFVTETINESNAEPILKEIVPALFVHPSIHLMWLAAFGVLAFFIGQAARKLLFLIAAAVFADAALGFYLGGLIPGGLLSVAGLSFAIAGLLSNESSAGSTSSEAE